MALIRPKTLIIPGYFAAVASERIGCLAEFGVFTSLALQEKCQIQEDKPTVLRNGIFGETKRSIRQAKNERKNNVTSILIYQFQECFGEVYLRYHV